MSLKMKLVSMISAFVLVIGMLLIGVFAVERVQVDMGGSITFNADDVYARVTGSVADAQVAPAGLDVTYSAYETEGNPTAWESLDLEFDSQATPIVISITVENLSTERSLTVNLTDALTSSVPNLGKALQRDNGAYTSGSNITLDPKDNGTSTTTFTITLSVTDKNQSLTNAQFDYDLNLYDESAVPEPPEVYSGFEFNILDENTAEITGYTGTDTEVIIPSTFSIGTTPITSFTMNEDGSNEYGEFVMIALYLGGFYYTPQGGERTYCANSMEFASIADTLAFPIYFEPQYTLSLDSYNENNLDLFVNYIGILAEMQGVGYSDGNFYFTTADGQYNNTLVNTVDIYNSISSVQDPTELQSMFPMQLNLASTFGEPVYVEGDDYVVKSIGRNAFNGCSGLTSVDLSGCTSLTSIGYNAFRDCSGLTSVDLSGCTSLTSIEDYAFNGCSGLTSISLPSSLTSIGLSALSGCSKLQPSATDQGVKYLGSEQNPYLVLWDGKDITSSSYIVNSNCKVICSSAFSGCDGLTSITLPSSLTNIEMSAFSGCDGLTSITLPSSLTSIGMSAFSDCAGLLESIIVEEGNTVYHSEGNCLIETESNTLVLGCKNSIIPSYITSIGDYAFSNCSELTSIDLSNCTNLTSIGEEAFSNCDGLTSIDLGNCTNLTSIKRSSFFWCERLEELILPASITSISGDPFYGCSEIEIVEFKGTLLEWLSVSIEYGGNTWITSSHKFIINGEEVTNLVIPEGIEVIGDQLFKGCSGLTSITLPSSLTSIGMYAFSGCNGLTGELDLSNLTSLTSIGRNAFAGCRNLTSITLPSRLTSIGMFAFSGCRNLTSIIVEEGNTVYHSEGNCLIETESNTLVLGCKNSIIPSYITSIGEYAFEYCDGLTSITLPSSLTSIGSDAFRNCSRLREVIIDSEYVYTNTTSTSACGGLFRNSSITTVKVLASLDDGTNSYITANFSNVTTEGDYTVYRKQ